MPAPRMAGLILSKSYLGDMTNIATKLWGFCHTLRHDGDDYGDYIEELPSSNKSVQKIVSLRRL